MSQWIYRLARAPQEVIASAADDRFVAAIMDERDGYLGALKAAGILILAGPARHGTGSGGITIFEAPDEASARAVMQTDPAVASGVMTGELYPYAVVADAGTGAGAGAGAGAANAAGARARIDDGNAGIAD